MADEVWRYWEVCRDYVKEKETSKRDNIANRWLLFRELLISKARSLANLGKVDGCVVVDRQLQLRGFGGKIGFDNRDPVEGGMRHNSAHWLCQVVPGTIAFVVSQDGDLTVYFINWDHGIKVTA